MFFLVLTRVDGLAPVAKAIAAALVVDVALLVRLARALACPERTRRVDRRTSTRAKRVWGR